MQIDQGIAFMCAQLGLILFVIEYLMLVHSSTNLDLSMADQLFWYHTPYDLSTLRVSFVCVLTNKMKLANKIQPQINYPTLKY